MEPLKARREDAERDDAADEEAEEDDPEGDECLEGVAATADADEEGEETAPTLLPSAGLPLLAAAAALEPALVGVPACCVSPEMDG